MISSNLTNTSTLEYGFYAPANSGAGISLPQSRVPNRRSLVVPFFTPKIHFMAGRMEALRSAVALDGKANSVRPATMISLIAGSSSIYQESAQ